MESAISYSSKKISDKAIIMSEDDEYHTFEKMALKYYNGELEFNHLMKFLPISEENLLKKLFNFTLESLESKKE